MKKKFLLPMLIALFTTTYSFAQKGSWVIDLGGSYDKAAIVSDTHNSVAAHPNFTLKNWSLDARVGYHFSNHILAGVQFGRGEQNNVYDYYTNNNNYDNIVITNKSYKVGVYGRYTQWFGKHIFVYGQLSVLKYGNDVSSEYLTGYYNLPVSSGAPSGIDGNGVIIDLSPVVGINLFRGYGLHVDVGGINYNILNSPANKINELNITLGHFSFGVQKILGWKKHQLSDIKTEAVGK
jgi:hypothetical protein